MSNDQWHLFTPIIFQYEFTDQGKKLKCTGGKEIEYVDRVAIYYSSPCRELHPAHSTIRDHFRITGRIVKYPILYCYETQGWADQNGSLNPVVKADEALFFACKAKGTADTVDYRSLL